MYQVDIARELGVTRQYVSQVATPMKAYARSMVGHAIKNGRIVPPAECSECNAVGKVHAHHTDYMDPLNVTWLCHKCHTLRHVGEPKSPSRKRVVPQTALRPKSEAAVVLGRKRWDGISPEERRAHALMMVAGRRKKRLHRQAKVRARG